MTTTTSLYSRAKVRRKNRTAKKKGGFPLPNWHKAVKPYNYENASISSPILCRASFILSCCTLRGRLRDDA